MLRALLVAMALVVASSSAPKAALFRFSYEFETAPAMTGLISGSASGDIVFVNRLFGVRVGDQRVRERWFTEGSFGTGVRARVSFSGEFADLIAFVGPRDTATTIFGFLNTLDVDVAVGAIDPFLDVEEAYNPNNWSLTAFRPGSPRDPALSALPLPAGFVLLGTALIGAVGCAHRSGRRSRRRAA